MIFSLFLPPPQAREDRNSLSKLVSFLLVVLFNPHTKTCSCTSEYFSNSASKWQNKEYYNET